MSSETKFVPHFIADRKSVLASQFTAWPNHNRADLEWLYRHGAESDVIEGRLDAAAIMDSYRELVDMALGRVSQDCPRRRA